MDLLAALGKLGTRLIENVYHIIKINLSAHIGSLTHADVQLFGDSSLLAYPSLSCCVQLCNEVALMRWCSITNTRHQRDSFVLVSDPFRKKCGHWFHTFLKGYCSLGANPKFSHTQFDSFVLKKGGCWRFRVLPPSCFISYSWFYIFLLGVQFCRKTSRLHGLYLLYVFVHCFPCFYKDIFVHVGSEMKCVLLVWSAWAILKTFSILSRILKISTSGLHIVSTAVIWALNGIKGHACLQNPSGWVPKKVCREVVSSKCPKGRKSYPRNAKRWSPRYGKNPFGVWRSLMHFVAHGYIVESPLTSTQCKMQNQQILKEMCTLLPVFLMFSVCFQVLKIWTASLSKQIKPGFVSCPVQACTWHWRPSKMSVEVDGPGHWDHDWLMGFFFMCFPNVFSVLFA